MFEPIKRCGTNDCCVPAATFDLWANAWLSPAFTRYGIEDRLPGVEVPMQAIQSEDDESGTELQFGLIAGKVSGRCETRQIPDRGHAPHLRQPQRILAEIACFVGPLTRMDL